MGPDDATSADGDCSENGVKRWDVCRVAAAVSADQMEDWPGLEATVEVALNEWDKLSD